MFCEDWCRATQCPLYQFVAVYQLDCPPLCQLNVLLLASPRSSVMVIVVSVPLSCLVSGMLHRKTRPAKRGNGIAVLFRRTVRRTE